MEVGNLAQLVEDLTDLCRLRVNYHAHNRFINSTEIKKFQGYAVISTMYIFLYKSPNVHVVSVNCTLKFRTHVVCVPLPKISRRVLFASLISFGFP